MTPQQEVEKLRAELAALHAVKDGAARLQPGSITFAPPQPVKLDLGCGNSTRRAITGMTKEKGWTGVDLQGTDGADVHTDLAAFQWPWPDSSVDEVNCAHMVEHVQRMARIHFFNELHRVLRPGGKANVIVPHWCSCRAYGDITHEWPPVSEMFWQYLDKPWREVNAPHVGFKCDFAVGYGYITAAWVEDEARHRNIDFAHKFRNEAVQRYKEAAQDMQATLTARK